MTDSGAVLNASATLESTNQEVPLEDWEVDRIALVSQGQAHYLNQQASLLILWWLSVKEGPAPLVVLIVAER